MKYLMNQVATVKFIQLELPSLIVFCIFSQTGIISPESVYFIFFLGSQLYFRAIYSPIDCGTAKSFWCCDFKMFSQAPIFSCNLYA
jgi:hypothetical protein